jgi:hypothetical protein
MKTLDIDSVEISKWKNYTIIIIIGSTALCGPWPFSGASASRPADAFSVFVTFYFSWVELSAPRPTPSDPGGPMFSVRVVSLS